MDVFTLTEKLNEKSIESVYFLHGDEEYLIARFLEKIRNIVVQGPMADFNYSRKLAREVSGAQIVADAKSMPMMASKKLLIIEDADKIKAKDFEPIVEYLDSPSPESCLVFTGKKFDLRKGVFKKANGKKFIHKADVLKDRDLPLFVKSRAKLRKATLSSDAIAAVCTAVGADCAALDDAIERLVLYTAGKPVEAEHVEAVISSIRHHSVFELVDALGTKNTRKALHLLGELLSDREEPIRVNSVLARHLRQLLQVRISTFLNMDNASIAKSVGIPPYFVGKLIAQSRGFSGAQLENSLKRLGKADFELKSSKKPKGLILEAALMDLTI